MSILDLMQNLMGNKYFLLLVVVGLIAVLVWFESTKENLEIEENDDIDEDLFDAPASQELPDVVKPQPPQQLPDTSGEERSLADFYNDNLRGLNQSDPHVEGINDRLPGDNYGSSYTLGVNLDEKEAKDLGVIHRTNTLTSDDLLPKEKKDWFDTPNVGISVKDANLLADASFRIGADTQGNYRKGMTTDPRGPIPVPKVTVGPWNQSSRDPDTSLGWCAV